MKFVVHEDHPVGGGRMTVGHWSDGVHEVEVMDQGQGVCSLRSRRSDGPRSLLKQDPVLIPDSPDPASKSVRGLQEDNPLVSRNLEGVMSS